MARSVGIHIDDHELRELQIDMRKAPIRVKLESTATLRRAAALVDKGMRADFSGHIGSWFTPRKRHKKAAKVEKYVSHEMLSPLVAEIGVESGRGKKAGNLAIVLASVTPRNPVPTVDRNAALRRSTPAILHMFGDVVEDSVLGKGGGH